MPDTRQVFIIGDSLFAESLTQLLVSSATVVVAGVAPDVDEALPQLHSLHPDAVIMAGTDTGHRAGFGPLSALLPALPIIYADLKDDYVQVITSRRIGTHYTDLLAAIQSLPHDR